MITQPTAIFVWWTLLNAELEEIYHLSFHLDILSSIAPVLHSAGLPVPSPPTRNEPSEEKSSSSKDTEGSKEDYDLAEVVVGRYAHYPKQEELNDLFKDIRLTKSNAELLFSMLKGWDFLDESVKVSSQGKRHQDF